MANTKSAAKRARQTTRRAEGTAGLRRDGRRILHSRGLNGGGLALCIGHSGLRGLFVAMPPVHEIDDGEDDDDSDDSHARCQSIARAMNIALVHYTASP